MMKVLVVSVGKLSGGIEKYTINLGKCLEKRNIDVHYAVRRESWLSQNVESNQVIQLDMSVKNLFKSMKKLKNYAEEHTIDIVHCNSNNALLLALLIKKKKIAVIHGDVAVDQAVKGRGWVLFYKRLENILIKKCDGCIAVSNSIKNILVNRGIEEDNVSVIYNGIELVSYGAMPKYNQDPLRICCVGSLIKPKNQIILLKALNYIKNSYSDINIICDIYGDGIEREYLAEYIIEHQLYNVNLCGFCTDVREKLVNYSLYVQPSIYESFGLAVVEAMAAGCCVVVSDIGGLKEVVGNDSGLFFDYLSEKNLAEKIIECYENRIRMQELGKKGKETAEKFFSNNNMEKKIIAYYESILGVE